MFEEAWRSDACSPDCEVADHDQDEGDYEANAKEEFVRMDESVSSVLEVTLAQARIISKPPVPPHPGGQHQDDPVHPDTDHHHQVPLLDWHRLAHLWSHHTQTSEIKLFLSRNQPRFLTCWKPPYQEPSKQQKHSYIWRQQIHYMSNHDQANLGSNTGKDHWNVFRDVKKSTDCDAVHWKISDAVEEVSEGEVDNVDGGVLERGSVES